MAKFKITPDMSDWLQGYVYEISLDSDDAMRRELAAQMKLSRTVLTVPDDPWLLDTLQEEIRYNSDLGVPFDAHGRARGRSIDARIALAERIQAAAQPMMAAAIAAGLLPKFELYEDVMVVRPDHNDVVILFEDNNFLAFKLWKYLLYATTPDSVLSVAFLDANDYLLERFGADWGRTQVVPPTLLVDLHSNPHDWAKIIYEWGTGKWHGGHDDPTMSDELKHTLLVALDAALEGRVK